MLLMPGCASADALGIGEGVRRGVSALGIAHPASATAPHVTVSVGLAARTASHQSPQDLIRAADEALYRAKRSGRNRLDVADDNGGQASAPTAT